MANSRVALETQSKLLQGQIDLNFSSYDDIDKVGWDKWNHSEPCSYGNYSYFNLTLDQCRQLARGAMGRHPLAVYRWLRFTINEVINFVTTATQATALDILNTRQLIEMDIVRRIFVIPFVREMNFDFYARLDAYHDNVGHITRTQLVSILVASILVH